MWIPPPSAPLDALFTSEDHDLGGGVEDLERPLDLEIHVRNVRVDPCRAIAQALFSIPQPSHDLWPVGSRIFIDPRFEMTFSVCQPCRWRGSKMTDYSEESRCCGTGEQVKRYLEEPSLAFASSFLNLL